MGGSTVATSALPYPFKIEMEYVTKFTIFGRVMKSNLMQYLTSVYFVNQPLHGSDIFVAHHHEVYCIYTTICTYCAFQLTVCWPAGQQTVN